MDIPDSCYFRHERLNGFSSLCKIFFEKILGFLGVPDMYENGEFILQLCQNRKEDLLNSAENASKAGDGI